MPPPGGDTARGTPAPRSPVEPVRREQILEAALRVFAQRGYTAATIKQIAAAAHLKSSALLYHYYPNKEALFEAVILRYARVLGEDPVGAAELDEPPERFLRGVMQRYLERFRDPNTLMIYRVLVIETPLLRGYGAALARQQPGNIFSLLEEYLARQDELGALRVPDAAAAARAVVALLAFNVQSRFSALLEAPPADGLFIEQTLGLLLDGLRPR